MAATLLEFIGRIQPLIREKSGGIVEEDDIKEALNRGIRDLKATYGVYASKNRSSLEVYPNVYEYACPSDYADVATLRDRGTPIDFDTPEVDDFWNSLYSKSAMITDDAVLGTRVLLVKYDGGSSAQAHACDAYDSNGTWAADTSTSDASNVRTDDVNFKSGSGSVSFDLTVAQNVNNYGAISNSTMAAVDLSDYEDVGRAFMDIYLPSATYITSIMLRWGSSDTNYWEASATTQFSGLPIMTGWNRLGFAWSGATETGTPSASAVDFLYVRVTYSASQANMAGILIDNIFFGKARVFDFEYYSTYFVQSSSNVKQNEFSADSDTTLLIDEDDDVLMFYAMQDAHLIREQYQDITLATQRYARAARLMAMRRGSGRKRKVKSYYRLPR